MKSATGSTIRDRSPTATATWSRGGPTPTGNSSRPARRCSSTSTASFPRRSFRVRRSTERLTIGENIGDLGGLSIAYKAYHRGLRGGPLRSSTASPATSVSSRAGPRIWRSKYRGAGWPRLATDSHSPAEFRCNGVVRNLPEFYSAFGVKQGDKLWLPAESAGADLVSHVEVVSFPVHVLVSLHSIRKTLR